MPHAQEVKRAEETLRARKVCPTSTPVTVASGEEVFTTTAEALLAEDQIDTAEYVRILAQPLGFWLDFGGGAAARWSVCRTEERRA